MWPGFIKNIYELFVAAIAGDGSVNVTLVGGAVGGQTVAQGNPNAGGASAWPVVAQADGPANGIDHSIQTPIGNTATPISASPTAFNRGFRVIALSTNAETVWIGGAGITAGKGDELKPGASLTYGPADLQNAALLYGVTAGGGSCKINVVGYTKT